ncbi:MAG: DUF1343 domain-containing protein [Spirochaetota bacterium]
MNSQIITIIVSLSISMCTTPPVKSTSQTCECGKQAETKTTVQEKIVTKTETIVQRVTQPRLHPAQRKVRLSTEEFYRSELQNLRGKKVLLVSNPSGIGRNPEKLQKQFAKYDVTITAILGMEHGFLGLKEDFSRKKISRDAIFAVPVFHAYRTKKENLHHLLETVDTVLFSVQDMGMRCYTYITVLKRLLDAAAGQRTQILVLDQVSPSLHLPPRGDTLLAENQTFAGEFPSLVFTGMSIGEAALFYNAEYLKKSVKLKVIPVKGYRRGMRMEETGIAWNTPSPNLPTIAAARNYQALVNLEGVNVSVGRGTQAPFVYFGAPWMQNPEDIIKELHIRSDYKVLLQPVYFQPTFSMYKGKICRGIRMQVLDPTYDPVHFSYHLLKLLKQYYPNDFRWRKQGKGYSIDKLWGSNRLRLALDSGMTYAQLQKLIGPIEEKSLAKVKPYYLYKPL